MRKALTAFIIGLSLIQTTQSRAADTVSLKEAYAPYVPALKEFHKNLTDAFTILGDLPINDGIPYLSEDKQQAIVRLNDTLTTSLSTVSQYPLKLRAHIITDLANYKYFLKRVTNLPLEFDELLNHYNYLKDQTDIRPTDRYHSNISFMKIFTNELVGQTNSIDNRRYKLDPYKAGLGAILCSANAYRNAPNKDRKIYACGDYIDLAWMIPLQNKSENLHYPLRCTPHQTTLNSARNLIKVLNEDIPQNQQPFQSTALSLFESKVSHILKTDPVEVKKEIIFSTQTLITTLYDREICAGYDAALTELQTSTL